MGHYMSQMMAAKTTIVASLQEPERSEFQTAVLTGRPDFWKIAIGWRGSVTSQATHLFQDHMNDWDALFRQRLGQNSEQYPYLADCLGLTAEILDPQLSEEARESARHTLAEWSDNMILAFYMFESMIRLESDTHNT